MYSLSLKAWNLNGNTAEQEATDRDKSAVDVRLIEMSYRNRFWQLILLILPLRCVKLVRWEVLRWMVDVAQWDRSHFTAACPEAMPWLCTLTAELLWAARDIFHIISNTKITINRGQVLTLRAIMCLCLFPWSNSRPGIDMEYKYFVPHDIFDCIVFPLFLCQISYAVVTPTGTISPFFFFGRLLTSCLCPAQEFNIAWMVNGHENSQAPSLDKSQLWSLDVAPNIPLVWVCARLGMCYELITHRN